jgi:hypothetical protein
MLPEELDSVGLVMQYYRDEVGITDDDYNEDKAIQSIKSYSIGWNLFLNVAYDGTRPVGLVAGFVADSPVTNEVATGIQFLYLLQSHASRTNYMQLLGAFEDWSIQVKAVNIKFLGIGKATPLVVEILDDLGYSQLPHQVLVKEIA